MGRVRVGAVVRGNPGLRRLALAHASSTLGYWAATIAVLVYAYDEGGTALVGVAAFVRIFPAALAAPFAGAIADRYSRERVLVVGDLLRTAVLACAGGAVAVDAPPGAVLALVGLNAALFSSFRPAMRALTPALARTSDELTAANVLGSTVEGVGMLLGPAVGGLMLGAGGPATVFALAAASLGVSAALVARIRVPERLEAARTSSFVAELAEGARVCVRDGAIRLVLLLTAAQTFSYGVLSVLLVVLVADVIAVADAWVGYLNAMLGVGGLAGAVLVAPRLGRRLSAGAAAGLAAWAVPLGVIAVSPSRGVALAALAVVGLGNTLLDVSLNTTLQRIADPHALARIFSMVGVVTMATIAVGGLVAPALDALIGTRGALAATGLLLAGAALASVRGLRALDRRLAETA